MTPKRAAILLVIAAVLIVLAYLQFRAWQDFDWHVFWTRTRHANWWLIFSAVAIVYFDYYLRAVRWKLFLRPVKHTQAASLTPSMFIGFTALALLGRPGELIRPYLVAKKENLTVSSQLAVWTVERIFDMSSFAILLSANLIFARSLQRLAYFEQFQRAGFVLATGIAVMALGAFLLWRNTDGIANLAERVIALISRRVAHVVGKRLRSFGDGLHTLHDLKSFFQIAGLSLFLWATVALVYLLVCRAYGLDELRFGLPEVMLLMGSSMVGSMLQLPAVGGGSQLATIAMMVRVFKVPPELALSCGIMLWLVTFVSVTPAGLFLARREHVRFKNLQEEE